MAKPTRKNKNDQTEQRDWPEQIIGRKYVRLLEGQLRQLRDESAHGNRELFLDDVFVVYLLAFFNPTLRSLRTIEDFSQTRQVQQHLSIRKLCKSTLADFNQLAQPERLEKIIAALRDQVPRQQNTTNSRSQRELHELLEHTVAVDGTFVPALADVAWAVANSNNHGVVRHRARLDAHLHVSGWLPEAIVVPEPGQSEADSAIEHLQAGKIYLYDRGYISFDLLRAHYAEPSAETSEELVPRSHFVVRYKAAGSNSPELEQAVDRELSEQDRAAGVVSDRVGLFTSGSARRAGLLQCPVREVVIEFEQDGRQKSLRLITNLLDVSAEHVGVLYRYRWQVELFFRWLKSYGNFGHLISHQRNGVLTHLYVTIIAVLLMYLHTGYRPSKYLFALLQQVAAGAASLDEVIPILRERERRCELDRQSQARRAAKKKNS